MQTQKHRAVHFARIDKVAQVCLGIVAAAVAIALLVQRREDYHLVNSVYQLLLEVIAQPLAHPVVGALTGKSGGGGALYAQVGGENDIGALEGHPSARGVGDIALLEYLKEKGFEAKAKGGESMEVCFIEGDYRDFLRQQIPDLDTKIGPGYFVDNKGVKIGQHKGFPYYTIGQRKGLGIALGHPAHVLRINAEKNTVMLGTADDLKTEYMLVEDAMIINQQELLECPNLTVRIRYRSKPIPCQVCPLDNGQMLVRFLSEASAIAPGQSAVFYDGQRVLGGAFIASQRGIFKIIADYPF